MNEQAKEFKESLVNPSEKKYFEFLYKQAAGDADKVLEVGSGWAISTLAFYFIGCGITTIDKQELDTLNQFKERLDKYEAWDRVNFVSGSSSDVVPKLENKSYDLIYIDGDHTYRGVKGDLDRCVDLEWNKIILDDAAHSKNWNFITNHLGEKTTEYGIARAVGEFCVEQQLNYQFYPYEHNNAFVVIYDPEYLNNHNQPA